MKNIYDDLCALLSSEIVSQSNADKEIHGTDKWFASSMPDVVVFAQCTDDVVKVMRYANEHEIPVYTRGAGVGYVGGCVPVHGGISLSVAQMTRIIEVSPEDGCVIVQPGAITGDIQDAASDLGWYYPPDPASLRECSIGGNIATNAGGPRCLKYGVTKQYILGLEIVTAEGKVMKAGGKCHKNKTGFDLATLMCGSEGMLGIITEATLRIIPHPEARMMLGASFPKFTQAAAAVQAILDSGVLPSALEITDGFTIAAARDYLGEEALPACEAYLMVEIDGRKDSVEKELESLGTFVKDLGAIRVNLAKNNDECEAVWQLRRDFSYSLRHTGLTKLNEDIVVPRSKLVELVEFANELQQQTGIAIACFGHAGDGNIHTNLMVEDYTNPKIKKVADAALDQLFGWVMENDGAITGEHGVGIAKSRWFKQAIGEVCFDAHVAIKRALDPKGILNPGKFLG